MSFFKKLFGLDKESSETEQINQEESPVFYAKPDEEMRQAIERARQTFKYFWREVYWENRRIVPALEMYSVKAAFSETNAQSKEEITEHMWLVDIYFDGEYIYGTLINEPNQLQLIKAGEEVRLPLHQISDWIFACEDKAYGAFTVQLLRSRMNEEERQAHDDAWGYDFGDFNDISVVYQQKEHPENLEEHPMSVNSKEKIAEELAQQPEVVTQTDEHGYTFLHHAAIAGNTAEVEALLAAGADKNAQTNHGKTALDFAQALGWQNVIQALS